MKTHTWEIGKAQKLKEALPRDFTTRTYDHLAFDKFSKQDIAQVASGKRFIADVRDALSWVAIENLLTKLLTA